MELKIEKQKRNKRKDKTMDARNKQEAKKAYDNAKNDIANLLGFFECEIGKTPDKINWGHVGTLEAAKGWLIDALSILSGMESDAIKETLEETRIDNETQNA